MSTIILLLFQLWNQPSVRMLGFGKDFAGFVPDPITDLLRNPAYLKEFGTCDATFNSLQIYASTRNFDKIMDSVNYGDVRSVFDTDDQLSFIAFYPKIGIGCKMGAFTRIDERNNLNRENWLYGQKGLFGAFQLGKYLRIGGEYNYSWNDKPDKFRVQFYDTSYNLRSATISHGERSNEWAGGIIIGDQTSKNWQLAISYKKNSEIDTFLANTVYEWPDEWLSEWNERHEDSYFYAKFAVSHQNYKVIWQFNYYDRLRIQKVYFMPADSFITRLEVFEPGMGFLYQPQRDITLVAAVICSEWRHLGSPTSGLIIPVGVEKSFGESITCRFGNTFTYRTKYFYKGTEYDYHIKNELNFGLDFRPYEKLNLYLATTNPFEYSAWLFGLSFAL